MAGKIQRIPRGFLQFLGMVGTGISPTEMADEVRSTIDMLPFLGAGFLSSRRITGLVTNPGDSVVLDVPNNEGWYLVGAQYGVVAQAAADQVACGFAIRDRQEGIDFRIDSFPNRTAAAATASLLKGHVFAQPIILMPGSRISMFLDDAVLPGARTGACAVVCYPFAV